MDLAPSRQCTGAVPANTICVVPRVQRYFPSDICAAVEARLSARPSGPNVTGLLDQDWAFVSCLASEDCAEIVVTLRAENRPSDDQRQPLDDPSDIDEDTHVVIAAADLDILNGRGLGMDVVDLALEQFLVFSRQASPDQVSGIIRLPGWDPGFE
jgi:hypothetical protein